MFSGGDGSNYSVEGHLAEINALLGPFPVQLLSEAHLQSTRKMFDVEGNILQPKLEMVVSLAERFEDLANGEGRKLEEFIRSLLAIDPIARPAASEALNMPWHSHMYTQSVEVERVS